MTPTFSVIVPTHSRPTAVAGCLEALRSLDYPAEKLEIVIVEDGGPAPELEELRGAASAGPRVIWAHQNHAGPAAARNHGARLATHDYLAFTDDDCRPGTGWLRALASEFEQGLQRVLGGHTENALTGNTCSIASQELVAYFARYHLERGTPFFASNNFAIAKAAFEKLGGFDESFPLAGGEDRDLCARCLADGLELKFVPSAQVDHYHPLSLGAFWRQHYRYGRGARSYRKKQAAQGSSKPFERLGFYFDITLHPFRTGRVPRKLRVSFLLLLSQVANTLGYLRETLLPSKRPQAAS